eukprot:scaffold57315_cov21-Tisochrysis_lutea.AAC.1
MSVEFEWSRWWELAEPVLGIEGALVKLSGCQPFHKENEPMSFWTTACILLGKGVRGCCPSCTCAVQPIGPFLHSEIPCHAQFSHGVKFSGQM